MYKIENLLNSPYDLIDADGQKVRIGPRETIETTLHPLHEGLYRAVRYFRIEAVAVDSELEEWRALYETEKGEAPDKRWGVPRIQKELSA